jgi:hypothetical protein
MNNDQQIEVWEQSPPGKEPTLKGKFVAKTLDEAVSQMLKNNPALNDLYRKEDGKHFLYQYQLFQTKEEAEVKEVPA